MVVVAIAGVLIEIAAWLSRSPDVFNDTLVTVSQLPIPIVCGMILWIPFIALIMGVVVLIDRFTGSRRRD
jgi:hypothetical protein